MHKDKKESQLQTYATEDRAASNAAITAADQPSALEQMRLGRITKWNDWKNSTGDYAGRPLDVTQAPDMNLQLGLFNRAKAGQDAERQGEGLITMGANAISPEYAGLLREQRAAHREQDAAGGLEDAFARKDAEMSDSELPLISLANSRAMGIAGLRSNQAQQSQSIWAGYRPAPGAWGNFKNALASTLGTTLGTFGRNSQGGWSVGRGGGSTVFAARGGYVRPGQRAVVGEEGFEYGVDDDGRLRVLGADEPELIRPTKGTTVIPHELSTSLAQLRGKMPEPSGDVGPAPDELVRPRRVTPQTQDMGLPAGEQVRKLVAAAQGIGKPVDAGASPVLAAEPSAVPDTPLFTRPASEFEPDAMPLTRRPKAQPAPGEMEANDELVRSRIDRAGGFAEMGDLHRRPRVADPLGLAEHRIEEDALLSRPTDRNGRGRSVWAGLKRGFVEGGPAGAIIGAATHAVDPSLDEQDDQSRMIGRDVAVADSLTRRRASNLALQGAAADVENKRQASPIKWAALDEKRLEDARRNVRSQITARKGTHFDANDPLLAQAEELGMHFDADSLNNAASNSVPFEEIDRQNPTMTRKGFINKVTGEITYYGAGKYTQPVGPDGMTAFQRGSLKLGGARLGETVRHNQVTETQGGERIGIARGHLTLAQAAQDNQFDETARKRFDAANKLAAKAEEYDSIASAIEHNREYDYKDPGTGEMVHVDSKRRAIERDKNLAQAAAARRELFTNYRDAFNGDDQGHVQMTEAEFKALFPTLAAKSAPGSDARLGEALRLGIDLTDGPGAKPDSTNYTPSPIKRRAPASRGAASSAAPSSGRMYTEDEVRAQARAMHKNEDAAVEKMRKAGRLQQ